MFSKLNVGRRVTGSCVLILHNILSLLSNLSCYVTLAHLETKRSCDLHTISIHFDFISRLHNFRAGKLSDKRWKSVGLSKPGSRVLTRGRVPTLSRK